MNLKEHQAEKGVDEISCRLRTKIARTRGQLRMRKGLGLRRSRMPSDQVARVKAMEATAWIRRRRLEPLECYATRASQRRPSAMNTISPTYLFDLGVRPA